MTLLTRIFCALIILLQRLLDGSLHQLGLQVVQYKHIAVQVLLRLPDDLLKFLLTALQRSYTLTMHSLAVL